jgi:hypothetical protein
MGLKEPMGIKLTWSRAVSEHSQERKRPSKHGLKGQWHEKNLLLSTINFQIEVGVISEGGSRTINSTVKTTFNLI